MKENYQEALKKVTFSLLSSSVPFSRQNYQNQKGPGTSEEWLFRLWNKFRKIPLLVMHYLTKFDEYKVVLELFICKFMQASLWHHKLFHFHLPFWIWKVWKGRDKIKKIWISREYLFWIYCTYLKIVQFESFLEIHWFTDSLDHFWLVPGPMNES